METAPPTWTARVVDAAGALAERRGLLLCVLLAVHGIARPYAHLIHDAQLYGVQVLNQIHPQAYADDLFLRYGSQDDFSVFSRLAAPPAALLGLPIAFFLLYVACDVLFVWAAMRLVLAVIPDRIIAVLSLLYVMVTPL